MLLHMCVCYSRCPHYPQTLPSYCRLVNVPGQCCQSMTCDVPGYGTYNPVPQLNPTPAPGKPPASMPPPNPSIQITTPASVTVFPGQGYPISSSQITQVTSEFNVLYFNCQMSMSVNEII